MHCLSAGYATQPAKCVPIISSFKSSLISAQLAYTLLSMAPSVMNIPTGYSKIQKTNSHIPRKMELLWKWRSVCLRNRYLCVIFELLFSAIIGNASLLGGIRVDSGGGGRGAGKMWTCDSKHVPLGQEFDWKFCKLVDNLFFSLPFFYVIW